MYSRDLGGQGLVSWVESPHALNPSQRTTTMQNRLVHQTLNPKTRVISRATILIIHLSGLVTSLTIVLAVCLYLLLHMVGLRLKLYFPEGPSAQIAGF